MTRRLWAVLAAGLLLLLMGGCAGGGDAPDGPREVDYFGETYLVDPAAGTLSDGANTYAYSFSGDATSYRVDITYPDDSTYWFTMDAGHGSGGWSDNYDRERYVDGETLCAVLVQTAPEPERNRPIWLILLLLVVGVFNLAAPRAAWYAEWGWRIKDAEPSDRALVAHRISGVFALVVAVLMLVL